MRRSIGLFVLALLLPLVCGAREYDQPDAATYTEPGQPCYVARLDGKRDKLFTDTHKVSPGMHELLVVLNVYQAWGGHGLIDYTFEANKSYRVECLTESGRWRTWLVDASSGETVAVAHYTK